jgi:hypothetical protein
MKKFVIVGAGVVLLIALLAFFSAGRTAIQAATPAHAPLVQHAQGGCPGAEVATRSGTACVSPGTYRYLTGITQICNRTPYPVNFVGSEDIYIIPSGECQAINFDSGTVYVNS